MKIRNVLAEYLDYPEYLVHPTQNNYNFEKKGKQSPFQYCFCKSRSHLFSHIQFENGSMRSAELYKCSDAL